METEEEDELALGQEPVMAKLNPKTKSQVEQSLLGKFDLTGIPPFSPLVHPERLIGFIYSKRLQNHKKLLPFHYVNKGLGNETLISPFSPSGGLIHSGTLQKHINLVTFGSVKGNEATISHFSPSVGFLHPERLQNNRKLVPFYSLNKVFNPEETVEAYLTLLERVSNIEAKFLGKPVSHLPPLLNPMHISSKAVPSLPSQPNLVLSEIVKSLMPNTAMTHMEELFRHIQTNEPLWIKGEASGSDMTLVDGLIYSVKSTEFCDRFVRSGEWKSGDFQLTTKVSGERFDLKFTQQDISSLWFLCKHVRSYCYHYKKTGHW